MVRAQDRKFVSSDPEKCIGCTVCEYACSMTNEKTFNPTKSRIRALRLGPINNLAVACRHCEDPACVAACPRDALSQEEDTGIIMVDEEACKGCAWCISACHLGAMMMHPDKKVVFTCNSCKDQTDGPQCVKWCPEEALTFATTQQLAQKYRISDVKNLFQEAKTKKAEAKKTIQIGVRKESRQDFIKEVMKMPGGEKILECIQCGSCAGGCPTMFAMDYSPMQIIKMVNLGMKEKVLSSSTIWVCSTCYTCATRCPRNVNFPTLMMSLRNKIIRENLVKDCAKSDFHKYFFEVVNKYGRIHEPKLLVKLLDMTNFNSLLHNARLGLRLFKRGKLHLRAPKTEQTSWVCSILEKTDQKEPQ